LGLRAAFTIRDVFAIVVLPTYYVNTLSPVI